MKQTYMVYIIFNLFLCKLNKHSCTGQESKIKDNKWTESISQSNWLPLIGQFKRTRIVKGSHR